MYPPKVYTIIRNLPYPDTRYLAIMTNGAHVWVYNFSDARVFTDLADARRVANFLWDTASNPKEIRIAEYRFAALRP